MKNRHHEAWLLLKSMIRDGKTSWGKKELLELMSNIIDKMLIYEDEMNDDKSLKEDEIR